VVQHDKDQVRWWTWAGGRAGAVLAAALSRLAPGLVDKVDRFDNCYLRLSGDASVGALADTLASARRMFGDDLAGVEPDVTEEALRQLKFAELLPPDLAHDTLAARASDHDAAKQVLARRVVKHLL
jgi:ATP-dependent Lhr-like helicase